jgi:hypothetical protein
MSKNWIKKPDYESGLSTVQWILLIATSISLGIGLASNTPVSERLLILRYVYFLEAALFAFITPWILFPQKPLYLFLATNPSRKVLFNVLLGRLTPIFVGLLLVVTTISFAGFEASNITMHAVLWMDGLIFTSGIMAFAGYRFLRMGHVSQLWQEGNKGRKLLDYMKEAGSGPAVPAGSLPTIGNTTLVALAGMLAVILGSYLYAIFGVTFHAVGGIILLVVGLIGWYKKLPKLDVEFYHTHAFYNELFRNPGGVADAGRDPLPIQALYWVPSAVKSIVWLSLRQMDRKLPLGRLLIVAFLVYWSFIYGGFLSKELLVLIPFFVIFAKNMAVLRLTSELFAPTRFQYMFSSPLMWFLGRCFINFRWILLLHLFTFLTVWFVEIVTMEFWYQWLLFDIISAVMIPAILTWKKEGRIKYQYA